MVAVLDKLPRKAAGSGWLVERAKVVASGFGWKGKRGGGKNIKSKKETPPGLDMNIDLLSATRAFQWAC
jgi:hypothetical protein